MSLREVVANALTAVCCFVAMLCVLPQLDTSAAALLPHLNRDDLAAAAAGPKQQQQQQQMQRRGGMRMSRTGSTGPNASAVAAAAALAIAAAEEGKTGAGGGTAAGVSFMLLSPLRILLTLTGPKARGG